MVGLPATVSMLREGADDWCQGIDLESRRTTMANGHTEYRACDGHHLKIKQLRPEENTSRRQREK